MTWCKGGQIRLASVAEFIRPSIGALRLVVMALTGNGIGEPSPTMPEMDALPCKFAVPVEVG